MESQMNHIAQTVMIHREKVARREIGVLTANKIAARQYKIVAPSNPEKPIKYVRKPIDYTLLDEVGHGIHVGQRQGKRASNQSVNMINMTNINAASASVPPPTTKPPTPPNMGGTVRSSTGPKIISNTGTLGKSSRGEYRAPPVVIPPQVPSHYAPNYPIGHPRRQSSQNSDTKDSMEYDEEQSFIFCRGWAAFMADIRTHRKERHVGHFQIFLTLLLKVIMLLYIV